MYTIQLAHNQLVNSEASESKAIFSKLKESKGILQRLKGKPGRLRGNLQGKRVEFSSRTVISPDPLLEIDQVGVPLRIAAELTFPETVTDRNFERLKRYVENGPKVYPGAVYVEILGEKGRVPLYAQRVREEVLNRFCVGTIVHRHLIDNDIVLFNRQPSLHRQSILSMRTKVTKDLTLKFNECLCNPFNADFDGDEMNLHFPQTLPARAESYLILNAIRNILSAKNGEANIALIQDFYSTVYYITNRDFFCNAFDACQILLSFGVSPHCLPRPAILRPIVLFTGKQLMTAILRACLKNEICPSISLREKAYKNSDKKEAFDDKEGFAVLRNGNVCAGRLGKNTLGGTKGSLMHAIIGTSG